MSAEVRIQVSSVVNPVPENFWHSPLRRALCCLGHQQTPLHLIQRLKHSSCVEGVNMRAERHQSGREEVDETYHHRTINL